MVTCRSRRIFISCHQRASNKPRTARGHYFNFGGSKWCAVPVTLVAMHQSGIIVTWCVDLIALSTPVPALHHG